MSPTTTSSTAAATTSPFVLTLLTSPGSAALRIENSELPTEIQVDESAHREVARRLGAGVQVYDCDPNAHSFRFRDPHADLLDPGLESNEASTSSGLRPEPPNGQISTAAGWWLESCPRAFLLLRRPIPAWMSNG
jgi:hypothetical protein